MVWRWKAADCTASALAHRRTWGAVSCHVMEGAVPPSHVGGWVCMRGGGTVRLCCTPHWPWLLF